MTDLLWMAPDDGDENPNYVRRFEATVQKTRGDWAMLDRTAFYAGGGGQPIDEGHLTWDGGEADVVDVSKRGVVKHVLDGPLPPEGETVEGVVDWDRRYDIMRAHTGQHLTSAVLHELQGIGTARAEMEPGAATITLDGPASETDVEETLLRTRELLDDERPVSVRLMRREAVADAMPEGRADLSRAPDQRKLRVVEIGDLDICPCGGTHVGDTGEIAPIDDLRIEDDDGTELRLVLGDAERKR